MLYDFWYTTREKIKLVHNIEDPTKDAIIDRLIPYGSRKTEGYSHRIFKPYRDTKRYDWPSQFMRSSSYRLWLETDLISVNSLTFRPLDDAVIVPDSSYRLKNSIGTLDGPPYRSLELIISDNFYFGGARTWQDAIEIDGLWGYGNDTQYVGTLVGGINTTIRYIIITDSSVNTGIGIGDNLLIDNEQFFVSSKMNIDSTAVLQADLDDDVGPSGATVSVSDGTLFNVGEVIIIGTEKMFISDIVGNDLAVQRQYDGSRMDCHDAGVPIYVPRKLVVERNFAGSTATTHTNGTSIYKYKVPDDIETLCIGEVIAAMMEEDSGYGRQTGSGSSLRQYAGRSLTSLREDVTGDYYIRKIG